MPVSVQTQAPVDFSLEQPTVPTAHETGWAPRPNYKSHRRKVMFLPGSESNSSVVYPEAYSTLYHYPQSQENVKCLYSKQLQ
jgi:hypothetical protein